MKIMLKISMLIFAGLVVVGCDKSASSPQEVSELVRPTRIAIAESTTAEMKRVFPATIEASRHSALAFRVSGQLRELPVTAGMDVKKGDVLARLDQADFNNALADRQARYDLARIQFTQIESLIQKKYASQTKLDEARANLKAAAAALATATDNLSYTTLLAPFDGAIGRVDIENFQSVQAQVPVIELQDTHEIDINFSVPEVLLTQLDPKVDAKSACAEVRFESQSEQSFTACYKKHDSVPDAVTRTYRVVFSMIKPLAFRILPGMSVSIELDLTGVLLDEPGGNAVSVPLSAVFEKESKTFVWRLNTEMRTELVQVSVLRIIGEKMLINGISSGDRIVMAGVAHIQSGQKVRVIETERGL
jgi:RND family efflux transporter MFP subunit